MDNRPQERLRVLMLEDDADDAALIRGALERIVPEAEVRWTRTKAEFIGELDAFAPRLVLSDYRLAGFDGLEALALVRRKTPEIPFILISGTIGEERAVEALRSGATDYVLKDRLERLEAVLLRALRESRERASRLNAEAALDESRAQLLQSHKMEALGRLSGGVAHDFNNILTAITAYSELALAKPGVDEEVRTDLREILNAAFRAAALTRQLLAFSRRQIFTPKIVDLNRSLADLDRMLQRIIGEDIKLSVVPAADLLRVRVDADQIGQVILNLVVNARDAMPGGGALTLRTANVELDAADLRAQPSVLPGRFVRLSVEDDGEGMDTATLARLFEPFFTTKLKGTGLGLATVYGIVKQSAGFIEAASAPGSGTVFRIFLPAVEAASEAAGAPAEPEPRKGTETVLVVDDDAAVRNVARRILDGRGYTVLAAQGGEEGLRLAAGSSRPVDLLITDVVMAGMGGRELARRVKKACPACRVLFTSGYPEGEAAASNERFIAKPFTTEELIRSVRRLLDVPTR
jgi:signal transduction histidine kinase